MWTINDDLHARATAELEHVTALALRLHERARASPTDIEESLERGFACLMSLEAALQRHGGNRSELADTAVALHGALTRVHQLSGARSGSWYTRGFVLPAADAGL